MNYRKAIGVASTSFFLMILLTKYQNCAPAPTQGNQGESSIDGEVRIVDRWSNEKLAFAEKQVVAHDAAQSVEVHGLCVKGVQGEKLSWTLQGEHTEALEVGESSCDRGGFAIHPAQLQELDCGVEHEILAESESGGADIVKMKRKCAPVAISNVMESESSGDRCDLELEADGSCHYTCYRGEKLMSRQEVDINQCPRLNASK